MAATSQLDERQLTAKEVIVAAATAMEAGEVTLLFRAKTLQSFCATLCALTLSNSNFLTLLYLSNEYMNL